MPQQSCHKTILVPRAYDPSGLRQESRALGATISGMRHKCRCAVSRITRIRLFPLFFHNGCSQSSRFLPQARRIVGSGDENAIKRNAGGQTGMLWCCKCLFRRLELIYLISIQKMSRMSKNSFLPKSFRCQWVDLEYGL